MQQNSQQSLEPSEDDNVNVNKILTHNYNQGYDINYFDLEWSRWQLCKMGFGHLSYKKFIEIVEQNPDLTKEQLVLLCVQRMCQDKQLDKVQLEQQFNEEKIISNKILSRQRLRSPSNQFDLINKKSYSQYSFHKIVQDVRKEISMAHIQQQKITNDDSYHQCLICYGKSNKVLSYLVCDHKFCPDCMKRYCEIKIQSSHVEDICCPQEECVEKLTDNVIQEVVDTENYKSYQRYKQRCEVARNPNLRFCIAQGCDKIVTINQNDQNQMQCDCGMKFCYRCSCEWHPNISCEQNMTEEMRKYFFENIQKCPSCKSNCEKQDGCNHMTCLICKYEFCWLCGQQYTKNHFSIMNPIGCSGLIYENVQRKQWPKWRIYLRRFQILLNIFLQLFILPLKLICQSIFVFNLKYDKQKFSFESFLLVLVGLIVLPMTLLVCILQLIFQTVQRYQRAQMIQHDADVFNNRLRVFYRPQPLDQANNQVRHLNLRVESVINSMDSISIKSQLFSLNENFKSKDNQIFSRYLDKSKGDNDSLKLEKLTQFNQITYLKGDNDNNKMEPLYKGQIEFNKGDQHVVLSKYEMQNQNELNKENIQKIQETMINFECERMHSICDEITKDIEIQPSIQIEFENSLKYKNQLSAIK